MDPVIRIKAGRSPYRRAGIAFSSTDWTELDEGFVQDDRERVLALLADPVLTIQRRTFVGEWVAFTQAEREEAVAEISGAGARPKYTPPQTGRVGDAGAGLPVLADPAAPTADTGAQNAPASEGAPILTGGPLPELAVEQTSTGSPEAAPAAEAGAQGEGEAADPAANTGPAADDPKLSDGGGAGHTPQPNDPPVTPAANGAPRKRKPKTRR